MSAAAEQRSGGYSPGRWVTTPEGYAEFVRDAAELVATHQPALPVGLCSQLSIFDALGTSDV